MSRDRIQNLLVCLPGMLAIAAGVSGTLDANSIVTGVAANEVQWTLRFLLDRITSRLSENAETKDYLDRSARRSFIKAILAACEARRRMLGYKPWSIGSIGDSEAEWLNRVCDAYKNDLAATERQDYQAPHMFYVTEAFDLILTENNHTSRMAALSAKISNLALTELELLYSPVPPKVEAMILQGWPVAPDDPQLVAERFTLFKFMCAFFAEEMVQSDSKTSRVWTQKILKSIYLTVEDFSQRLDKSDRDSAERSEALQTQIAALNSAIAQSLSPEELWQKISEAGEQASKRLQKLSAQTEIVSGQVDKILRDLAVRQRQFEAYRKEQRFHLDELRRDIAEFKTYLLQISHDEERRSALRSVRQRSLAGRCAGAKVAQLTEELIAEHRFLVGREEVIAQLTEIASTPPQLILVTAKPGNGKTALLADWVKGQDKVFVAYHFFSSRYERLRGWEDGLRNLLRQLYIYHGLDKDLPSDIKEVSDVFHILLNEVSDEPFVMVLDGLDEIEAAWGVVSPTFAQPLPKNVSLIASGRADQDENPAFLTEWLRNSTPIHLGELKAEEHFAAWLKQAGKGELELCAARKDFVQKVKAITRGYPLYLRFLIQDLVAKANESSSDDAGLCDRLESELDKKPIRFTEYVGKQWIELCQMDLTEPKKRDLFVLLTATLGPIPQADIEAVLELKGSDLTGLPPRVTRWLTKTGDRPGKAVYSFGHPTLAAEFSSAIDPQQVNGEVERLLRHCERWKEHRSPYVLRYYAEHLRNVVRTEDDHQKKQFRQQTLYSLARNEEFAREIERVFSDEPELSLHPIQSALLCAQEVDGAGMMAEFVFLHHHRMKGLTNQSLLKVFLDTDSLPRALKFAELLLNIDQENWALQSLGLAWELANQSRHDDALHVISEVAKRKDRLVRFRREDWKSLAVQALSHTFVHSDECWVVLQDRLLDDHGKLNLCLFCLSKELNIAEIERLERAVKLSDGFEKVRACLAIAQAKIKAGAGTSRSLADTLKTAKATAEELADEGQEAEAWALIARTEAAMGNDASESWSKADETATGISEDDKKEHVLSQIKQLKTAPTGQFQEHPPTFHGDLRASIEAAITPEVQDVRLMKNDFLKRIEQSVASIVQTPPPIEHHQPSETALQTQADLPQAIRANSRVVALVQVGRVEEALRMASTIGDSDRRARDYYLIVRALAESKVYDKALETCLQVGDAFWKARAYDSIARMQLAENRLEEAVATAEFITDDDLKANLQIAVALAYVQTYRDDEAIRTAAKINDYWKERGCQSIALAQVAANRNSEALKTIELIADDSSKGTVATLIAQAQAVAGRENEALETTRAISLNRGVELPKVAHAFVQARNRSGFKKLLLPSSYYLNACFEMTAQLAELYPEQAADIVRVLEEQG